jgi:hypothetical protein
VNNSELTDWLCAFYDTYAAMPLAQRREVRRWIERRMAELDEGAQADSGSAAQRR